MYFPFAPQRIEVCVYRDIIEEDFLLIILLKANYPFPVLIVTVARGARAMNYA